MNKPISVILNEAKRNIVKSINESNLHISMIDMIVKDIYLEVHAQAEVTLAKEKAEYEQTLKMQENKE